MKTITKSTSQLFVLILGIILSFSVSGQMVKTFTTSDKVNPESQSIKDQPGQSFFNVKPEGYQPVYKSTKGSIPQEIHHFYWAATSVWMADYNRMDSYSTSGKILSEIFIDANTGDTANGIFYTYDSQGRIDNILHQDWVNSNWENVSKQLQTYDVNGNEEVYLELAWQGADWNETYGQKYVYTYDANNHITIIILQFWDTAGDFWYNFDKYLYNYDENGYVNEYTVQWWLNNNWSSIRKELYTLSNTGVTTEILSQNYNNNNWVNSSLKVNIVWHSWNGYFNDPAMESYLQKTWNSGIWEDNERMNTTYDAFGGWMRLWEYYTNNLWVNAHRETHTCDAHSNFTCYTYEMWNGFSWTIDWGNNYILTYNGNDVIERTYQAYDHAMMVWYNTAKEQYSDFIYTQGIDMNSFMLAEIKLFPNPTNGILNLEIINLNKEVLTLEIANINGQVVYSNQMNASDFPVHKIDLSNCSKGVYFVKLQNTSEVKVGKVILQ